MLRRSHGLRMPAPPILTVSHGNRSASFASPTHECWWWPEVNTGTPRYVSPSLLTSAPHWHGYSHARLLTGAFTFEICTIRPVAHRGIPGQSHVRCMLRQLICTSACRLFMDQCHDQAGSAIFAIFGHYIYIGHVTAHIACPIRPRRFLFNNEGACTDNIHDRAQDKGGVSLIESIPIVVIFRSLKQRYKIDVPKLLRMHFHKHSASE